MDPRNRRARRKRRTCVACRNRIRKPQRRNRIPKRHLRSRIRKSQRRNRIPKWHLRSRIRKSLDNRIRKLHRRRC